MYQSITEELKKLLQLSKEKQDCELRGNAQQGSSRVNLKHRFGVQF